MSESKATTGQRSCLMKGMSRWYRPKEGEKEGANGKEVKDDCRVFVSSHLELEPPPANVSPSQPKRAPTPPLPFVCAN